MQTVSGMSITWSWIEYHCSRYREDDQQTGEPSAWPRGHVCDLELEQATPQREAKGRAESNDHQGACSHQYAGHTDVVWSAEGQVRHWPYYVYINCVLELFIFQKKSVSKQDVTYKVKFYEMSAGSG